MNINKYISKIRDNKWLNIIGVTIGLAGIVIGIIYSNISKSPSIQYDIISETNVVDINEKIEHLSINYYNKDITVSKEILKIINLRVSNIGNAPVLENSYDSKTKWGLTIDNCELLDVKIIDSNSEYLMKNVNPREERTTSIIISPAPAMQSLEKKVIFNNVIIESGEYFVIKLLILHSEDVRPNITPNGKIVGVRAYLIKNTAQMNDELTFFEQIFSGNIIVNISKVIIFFLIGIALLILILIVFFGISGTIESADKRRRAIIAKKISIFVSPEISEKIKYFLDKYIEFGFSKLKIFLNITPNFFEVLSVDGESIFEDYYAFGDLLPNYKFDIIDSSREYFKDFNNHFKIYSNIRDNKLDSKNIKNLENDLKKTIECLEAFGVRK